MPFTTRTSSLHLCENSSAFTLIDGRQPSHYSCTVLFPRSLGAIVMLFERMAPLHLGRVPSLPPPTDMHMHENSLKALVITLAPPPPPPPPRPSLPPAQPNIPQVGCHEDFASTDCRNTW
mmetsp:Transcript_35657/g.53640  ORF Transcript_35657/g.53640 Transcript_35657/m.53640 type:complete len:120 (-) Transcript_35657:8-367(-)